jgi:hypothetical protein
MKLPRYVPILLLAASSTACESVMAPEAERSESLELVASDSGELVSPSLATFAVQSRMPGFVLRLIGSRQRRYDTAAESGAAARQRWSRLHR